MPVPRPIIADVMGDFAKTRDRAYDTAMRIQFDGAFFRQDIGNRALAHPV